MAQISAAPVRTASPQSPMTLMLWATDDMKYTSGTSAPLTRPRPPVLLTWSKYRGPGDVVFEKAKPAVDALSEAGKAPFNGKATTSVKFSEPGEYVQTCDSRGEEKWQTTVVSQLTRVHVNGL